jgi:phage shock protein E
MLRVLLLALIATLSLNPSQPFAADGTRLINGKYVIDVRTEAEWNTGHIDGAILIPDDQIKEKISQYIKNKKAPIALYCRTGRRAASALDTLKAMGYTNAQNYGSQEEAVRRLKQ